MSESKRKPSGKLAEIFAKINMSDLPAMSAHVQEILDLTSNKKYLKHEHLTKIVLQDYSLTNKVLQFANSAYYSPGQKVSTVSMAVAILGFDTVRDLCLAIALFDDFIQDCVIRLRTPIRLTAAGVEDQRCRCCSCERCRLEKITSSGLHGIKILSFRQDQEQSESLRSSLFLGCFQL